jgi:hypothetical protein
MGFTKYFIPDPQDFYNYLERIGPLTFVAIKKFDALMGDSKSIQMLDRVYEMAKTQSSDSEILTEIRAMF